MQLAVVPSIPGCGFIFDGLMATICQKTMVHCQRFLDSSPGMIHCVVFCIPFGQCDMLFYAITLSTASTWRSKNSFITEGETLLWQASVCAWSWGHKSLAQRELNNNIHLAFTSVAATHLKTDRTISCKAVHKETVQDQKMSMKHWWC